MSGEQPAAVLFLGVAKKPQKSFSVKSLSGFAFSKIKLEKDPAKH
ncbi:MAG: hypothetical protein ABIA04_16485 [Pseudomonadota bacterium]